MGGNLFAIATTNIQNSMIQQDLLNMRLYNQQISGNLADTPEQVVHALGAVQAQDHAGAKWSIALRTKTPEQSAIDTAITNRSIVRTWPMRGTLHFLASEDVRWMLSLLTPRVVSGMARRSRELELDSTIHNKSRDVLVKAMEGGKQLMRSEVYAVLENNGIAATNQRGIHIINVLAQNQVLCHGVHNDKQPTYVLLDEWIPHSRKLSPDEALAEIARRYFTGHGPATIQDFVWWTGLKITDARTALNSIAHQLTSVEVDGNTYWFAPALRDNVPGNTTYMLPGFDEFMLGYTNRSLMVDQLHLPKVVPGKNGVFMSTVVINGKVEALWKRIVKKDKVIINLVPFTPRTSDKWDEIEASAQKYGLYMGGEVILER